MKSLEQKYQKLAKELQDHVRRTLAVGNDLATNLETLSDEMNKVLSFMAKVEAFDSKHPEIMDRPMSDQERRRVLTFLREKQQVAIKLEKRLVDAFGEFFIAAAELKAREGERAQFIGQKMTREDMEALKEALKASIGLH